MLRFVLMLMILNLHSFKAPVTFRLADFSLGTSPDYLRESICICSVNCFVLIFGFFSITRIIQRIS